MTDGTRNSRSKVKALLLVASCAISVPSVAVAGQRAGDSAADRSRPAAIDARLSNAGSSAASNTPGAGDDTSTAAPAGALGVIAIIVRDAHGAPVPAADVVVQNVDSRAVVKGAADASGTFGVADLPPATYEITAVKAEFGRAARTVVVSPSRLLQTELVLESAAADAAASADALAPALTDLRARIDQLETELAALKPGAGQAAAATQTPAVDEQTPFAFGDFSWLNGSPRNKKVAFDSPFFTPEVRFDSHYMQSFNNPIDHTMGGATESFRSGEVQVEQASVGGDFHLDNVRGRILTMFGLFSATTPRNDASSGVGQWDVRTAYRYVSEAYGGYHFDVQHGLNVDAGIFVSYIGLFSYYNFDNWTYQPSYVSSNTPWFFNGLRIQWFPTNKLKIEPWFINGWQTYNKFNGRPGFGGQVLWMPNENLKVVLNNYTNGTDTLYNPDRRRFHTDDSVEVRYYNRPEKTGLSKMAMSFTADFGCEYGGGVTCTGGDANTPSQYFAGWMVYNRFWFDKDQWAATVGGGQMKNPGRYLTLLPPINGADAVSGSPYFPQTPGSQINQWDTTLNLQWMPKDFITFWWELGYRHSDVPYFSGRGGITPPGGNNGFPQYFVCSSGTTAGTSDLAAAQSACGGGPESLWAPDLRTSQTAFSLGIMVKF